MAGLRITKRAIDALPTPTGGDALYWDTDREGPPGFGVRVTPRGVISFVFQYRMRGQSAQRMTLGRYGALTPDQARELAKKHARAVAEGRNPVEERRKEARDAVNLEWGAYVDRFVTGYLKPEWPDSWQEAKARLDNHVTPHLRGKALPKITARDIGAVIDELRPQKALARNTFVLLRLLFQWACEPNRADLAKNPMAGMKPPPKPADRKRVLSPDEIVAAWRASYQLPDPFGPFVRLLFCTLQRRNEVARLPWSELSEAGCLWHLHGDRAKNEEDHLVHLNRLAMAELKAIGWRRRGLVFPSGTGKTPITAFSKMKRALDKAMLPILQELADQRAAEAGEDPFPATLERWTLHDIRRTGTTNMQALGVPVEVTEKVINHKSGTVSGVAKVYNLHAYGPEKRDALNRWGARLETLIGAAEASNVIALPERAA